MRNIPIKQIAEILGVDCREDFRVLGYQIDSSKIGPSELFFALKGKKTDGHLYLEEISRKGAAAAVVSSDYQGDHFGLCLLRVENVEEALQHLAKNLMAECKSFVIGITGSVGKTTTKKFTAQILSRKYRVGKTLLNYNTKLTLPITLLNRTSDEEILVLEMGMSEPNDIERLVSMAPPDIAVITKIAYAHGGNFERGIFDIAKNKAQIFAHPKTKKLIFDHHLYEFSEVQELLNGQRFSFSMENRQADYFLSTEGDLDERGIRAYHFDLPFKERHFLHDLLTSIVIARQVGLSFDEINQKIPELKFPKMRFEQFEKNGVLLINDAYNANPESMKAALEHIPQPKEGGKKIAVLGMMAEMGKEHVSQHELIGKIAQKYVDHLLVMGKEASPIHEAFQEVQKPAEKYYDFAALSDRLKSLMRPGDVVLIKASRCVEMERLIELL